MTTIANTTEQTGLNVQKDQNFSALRFITCGSVDDGKSTLIGRLLVDSRSVLQDQVAGVTKGGEVDAAADLGSRIGTGLGTTEAPPAEGNPGAVVGAIAKRELRVMPGVPPGTGWALTVRSGSSIVMRRRFGTIEADQRCVRLGERIPYR